MEFIEIGTARVPALGLGTWQVTGAECEQMVEQALELGYRHIDTAPGYANEEEIGRAIVRSEVPREELFLATKLPMDRLAAGEVAGACDESLTALRTDYLDLLLIHWPSEQIPLEETLDGMLELKREGLVRHLGVSNFPTALMERAWRRTVLLTNQVEYHPYLAQPEVLAKAASRNMMVTAYCPLARGMVHGDAVLEEIGGAHGRTASQVALRWLVQQPLVAAIPRARSREHLAENLDIFDFELTEDELRRVHGLARGERLFDPDWAPTWDAGAARQGVD